MGEHIVQFYENDQFLIEKVSDFIGAGLGAGDVCIAIATPDHLGALEKKLRITPDQDNYIALNAHEILSRFMIESWPSAQHFMDAMGNILAAASANGHRRVRIFDEEVALLCAQENPDAAIQLEQCWHDLASEYTFSLLHLYPMNAFAGARNSNAADLHRMISMLQQKQYALEAEIARRTLAEKNLSQREQKLLERTTELIHANEQLMVEVEKRKDSEEALALAKHVLIEAQRIGHVGSWELNMQSGCLQWSDEIFRIFGLEPQSVAPSLAWVLAMTTHPDDRETFTAAVQQIMAGNKNFEIEKRIEWALPAPDLENQEACKNILLRIKAGEKNFKSERRLIRPDGAIRYVVTQGEAIFNDRNEVLKVVGSVLDITEQKQAQQKLQESEERFRSLVEMSSDWYWEQDAQMRFTKVFMHRTSASSVDPGSMLGMVPGELSAHWDEAKQRAFETAWTNRQPYHDLESCLTTPGSPARYYQSSGKPMFDATGIFIGYRGVTKEVTEHIRNIEDLRRFRTAMDVTADAIFLVDHASLTIVDANATACRILGYTREELLRLNGADLGTATPEQLRSLSNELVNGKDRGVEMIWLRHKDGSRLPVEMQRHALRSGQDWIIVTVARDITERKRAEAALRQSQEELRQLAAHQENIKEEERKRIAREIHDELGGVLTGIKANISVSIDRAVGAGFPADPLLVDSAMLADAAIETVRRVITDLRPSVLDQLGVWAALDWYAGQIQERSGLQCTCAISSSAANTDLDPERSTMLFRVVQEALTNVVRHAAASRVAISVEREDDAVMVEIRDDGKGIDAQRLLDGESWGILGMHERTRHFGGDIQINGIPGKGTAVVLRLPLEHANVS